MKKRFDFLAFFFHFKLKQNSKTTAAMEKLVVFFCLHCCNIDQSFVCVVKILFALRFTLCFFVFVFVFGLSQIDIDPDSLESHFECAELAPSKAIWDKALENGAKVPCPQCGVGGQKDNACTHMTCVKCHTRYCYLCGLANNKLDKAKGVQI